MKAALVVLLLAGCSKELDEYASKSKRTEAELQLNKLGKNLKAYAISASTISFPVAALGPTPAKPCCGQPNNICTPDPAMWDSWRELDFLITEPFRFQYAYRSDGTTFTATATGNLDCDETSIVYTLTGAIGDGVATTFLQLPTNGD